MGNFRPQGRGGFGGGRSRDGGRGFGGDRGGFSRDRNSERRSVEMYDATCSKCNKKCQVPFRPTGSKPVFCSECFGQQGDRGSSFSRDNNFSNNSNAPSVDLSGINAKLDKIIAILQELELDVVDDGMTDADDDSEDEEAN
ncbi:hypothetical protein J4423_03380 [Candidatus Pacearchaeota archaeon]|nr:hypothetical protein [Candidatus Pacearchaeota archaeon]